MKVLRSAKRRLPGGFLRPWLRFARRDERALVQRFNRLASERQFGADMSRDHEWFTARLLERMRPTAGDRVLEVGCGDGWACRMGALRAPGATFSGIDISDAALRQADPVADPALAVGLAQASAEVLPLRSEFFTAVFCVESFFLFPSLRRVLQEMERVLVPGGRAYLVQCLFAENHGALGWVDQLRIPVHVKGANDYRDLLVRSGWTEVEAVELRREAEPGREPNAHDHALLLVGRKARRPSM